MERIVIALLLCAPLGALGADASLINALQTTTDGFSLDNATVTEEYESEDFGYYVIRAGVPGASSLGLASSESGDYGGYSNGLSTTTETDTTTTRIDRTYNGSAATTGLSNTGVTDGTATSDTEISGIRDYDFYKTVTGGSERNETDRAPVGTNVSLTSAHEIHWGGRPSALEKRDTTITIDDDFGQTDVTITDYNNAYSNP